MPPLNDFYSIHDRIVAEKTLSCSLSFNAAHSIFNGHFPGNPIVPGVCTMQIIMDLLQEAIGRQLRLSHAANIKFMQLITPLIHPAVQISWTESEGMYTTSTILKNGEATLFKMNAVYAGEI